MRPARPAARRALAAVTGTVAGALAGAGAVAGCAAPSPADPPDDGALAGRIVVLAAASLTDVLPGVVADFRRTHPQIDVVVSLAGSSELVAQVTAGAPTDVLVTASAAAMAPALTAGAVVDAVPLARTAPVVVVPAGNPGGVRSPADLAREDLVVALCAPQVPCGAAADVYLDALGVTPAPDTLDGDVRAVLTRVRLGEVDAGVVYRTDARAAGAAVEVVAAPDVPQAAVTSLVAVPVEAPNPAAARAFVRHLLSAPTQETLRDAGFDAP